MMTRRTAMLFGGAAAAVALTFALLVAEIALRVVDGYGFGLRLRTAVGSTATTEAQAAAASTDPNAKWLVPSQAESYVRQLPVADGVDRAWFTLDPPQRPPQPSDPVLDARFAAHEGFRLSSIYEWNEAYVQRALCGETRFQMPVFSNVRDLFMFRAVNDDVYPQFRFMRGVRHRSGLHTNNFGWRGADLTLVKPDRTIRIAFVGASTTIDPHADPFSHPEYIERWLHEWARAHAQGIRFEVINAGREGVDIQGVAAVVAQEVAPVRPDFVVDYEGGNQFWPVEFLRGDLPPRPSTTAEQPWRIERYSAVAVRLHRVTNRIGEGVEPSKPAIPVDWPADLDEQDPPLDDPRLPTSLPKIVRTMDQMRDALAPSGATYVPSSFVWFVKPGMVLDRQRDSGIYTFLNVTYWPFTYAHIRRIADFQNRVFKKYAAMHQLPFIDLAASYPFDARLFFDPVHMTPAGIKLKAWLIFQQLLPEIERRIADGRLPAADRRNDRVHPAFTGDRRLVVLDDLRKSCGDKDIRSTR